MYACILNLIYIGFINGSDINDSTMIPSANLSFPQSIPFYIHEQCVDLDIYKIKQKSWTMHSLKDQLCFLYIKVEENAKKTLVCSRYQLKEDPAQLINLSDHSFPLPQEPKNVRNYDFRFIKQPSTNTIIFKLLTHYADDTTLPSWNIINPDNEFYLFTHGSLSQAKAVITDPKKKQFFYALITKQKENKNILRLRRYHIHSQSHDVKYRSILDIEGEKIDTFETLHHTFIINDNDILKLAYSLNNKIQTFTYNLRTKAKETSIYPEKVTDVFFGYDGKITHFIKTSPTTRQIIMQDKNNLIAQHTISFDPSLSLVLSDRGSIGAIFINNATLFILDLITLQVIGRCEFTLNEPCFNCHFFDENKFFIFEHAYKTYACDLRKINVH